METVWPAKIRNSYYLAFIEEKAFQPEIEEPVWIALKNKVLKKKN